MPEKMKPINASFVLSEQLDKDGNVIGTIVLVYSYKNEVGLVVETKSGTSMTPKGHVCCPQFRKGWKQVARRLHVYFSKQQTGWGNLSLIMP